MSTLRRLAAPTLLAASRGIGAPGLPGPSSPYARAIDESRAMLDQVLQLYPGTAVAVAVGDDIVWSTAFGFADVDRQRKVSRSTQFRIYEVAMPLTATVMERLAQDGRFDLDAPLQKYLPDLPETRVPVTARALAAHLAGTSDFADDEVAAAPCAGARDAARTLSGRLFIRPAGLAHSMSRKGYLLLSAAMEAATGKRFSELLNETVAGPAGMSSTMADDPRRFLPGRTPLLRARFPRAPARRATGGHELPLGRRRLRLDRPRTSSASARPCCGARSSATTPWRRCSRRRGRATAPRPDTASAGTSRRDARGRRYVWHGGRGVGGRSAIVVVPHARLVTVMLSNIEGERLDEHARRITAFFLEAAEAAGVAPDLIRARGQNDKPAPPFVFRAVPAPGE